MEGVAGLCAGNKPVAGHGAASRGVLHQHGPPGRVFGQQDEGACQPFSCWSPSLAHCHMPLFIESAPDISEHIAYIHMRIPTYMFNLIGSLASLTRR